MSTLDLIRWAALTSLIFASLVVLFFIVVAIGCGIETHRGNRRVRAFLARVKARGDDDA